MSHLVQLGNRQRLSEWYLATGEGSHNLRSVIRTMSAMLEDFERHSNGDPSITVDLDTIVIETKYRGGDLEIELSALGIKED